MANIKTINVAIDSSSWKSPHDVPPSLLSLGNIGSLDIDLDACLLFAGIWTRSPITCGITLADCWAWLRYFPAFKDEKKLKFRTEWTDIDFHQKAVASDELGVGFTTWALYSILGFQSYADTNHVMKKLGTIFPINNAKKGPAKVPDYIAYDLSGNMSVLECKGTQTNQGRIWTAIERGKEQKRNVKMANGEQFVHTLAAGMFIPQDDSNEKALLAIADPESDWFRNEIKKYNPEQILGSARQVAIAKELSLFGLTEIAAILAAPKEEQININQKIKHDFDRNQFNNVIKKDGIVAINKELIWSIPVRINAVDCIGVRFTGEMPIDELGYLTGDNAEAGLYSRIAEKTLNSKWNQENHSEGVLELKSPIGARYKIEWLK